MVGTRTWQVTPERFTRKLVSIIKQARKEFRPLVLVLDIAPPGPLLTHYLPGQDERHRIYQGVIERAVSGFDDPDIRMIRTEPMVQPARLSRRAARRDALLAPRPPRGRRSARA